MGAAGWRGIAEDVGEGGLSLIGGSMAIAIVRSMFTTLLGAIIGHGKIEDGEAAMCEEEDRSVSRRLLLTCAADGQLMRR